MAELTGADLVVFGGCGHWWQLERPNDAARKMHAFWQQLS